MPRPWPEKIASTRGPINSGAQSTISRLVNMDDVKAMIEQETIRLLENVPQAIDNIPDVINEMPRMTNVKGKELGFKATRKVLKAAGGRATNSPSPFHPKEFLPLNSFMDTYALGKGIRAQSGLNSIQGNVSQRFGGVLPYEQDKTHES